MPLFDTIPLFCHVINTDKEESIRNGIITHLPLTLTADADMSQMKCENKRRQNGTPCMADRLQMLSVTNLQEHKMLIIVAT